MIAPNTPSLMKLCPFVPGVSFLNEVLEQRILALVVVVYFSPPMSFAKSSSVLLDKVDVVLLCERHQALLSAKNFAIMLS